MINILKNALENRTSVEMIYMSEDGKLSQRTINVTELTGHHIKAYCHTKKCTRTFKVENILSVLPHKRKHKYVS